MRGAEVDIDLELAPADQPGVVRRPDLVVVDDKAIERVDRDGGLLRASDVLVVVEIVSPGSRRLDHVVKPHKYADAGIGHYWIVDLDEPVTLLDCHLAGPLGYADGGSITGTFTHRTMPDPPGARSATALRNRIRVHSLKCVVFFCDFTVAQLAESGSAVRGLTRMPVSTPPNGAVNAGRDAARMVNQPLSRGAEPTIAASCEPLWLWCGL